MRRAGGWVTGARVRRVVVFSALVVTVVLGAWSPAGAQDYPGGQATSGPLGVNPGTVPPGGTTTITGGGCLPGTAFTVFLGTEALTTGTTDADGRVDTTVTIPFDTVPGSYTLRAVCTGADQEERTLTGAVSVVLQSTGGGGLPFTGASSDRLIRIGVALCAAGAAVAAAARWLISRRASGGATGASGTSSDATDTAAQEPEVAAGG